MTLAGESRLFSYSDHLQGFSFDCRIRVSPIVMGLGSVITKSKVTVDVRGALFIRITVREVNVNLLPSVLGLIHV